MEYTALHEALFAFLSEHTKVERAKYKDDMLLSVADRQYVLRIGAEKVYSTASRADQIPAVNTLLKLLGTGVKIILRSDFAGDGVLEGEVVYDDGPYEPLFAFIGAERLAMRIFVSGATPPSIAPLLPCCVLEARAAFQTRKNLFRTPSVVPEYMAHILPLLQFNKIMRHVAQRPEWPFRDAITRVRTEGVPLPPPFRSLQFRDIAGRVRPPILSLLRKSSAPLTYEERGEDIIVKKAGREYARFVYLPGLEAFYPRAAGESDPRTNSALAEAIGYGAPQKLEDLIFFAPDAMNILPSTLPPFETKIWAMRVLARCERAGILDVGISTMKSVFERIFLLNIA